MENKNFTLSSETVQNILNYLSEKPYKEVSMIIEQIIQEVRQNQNDSNVITPEVVDK